MSQAPAASWQSALATQFGWNDPEDNGVGAWGTPTANTELVGVSLNPSVLAERFGDANAAGMKPVEVYSPVTGKKITAPIVDKGPADYVLARQGQTIDLTEGARRALGIGRKDPVMFRFADSQAQEPVDDSVSPFGDPAIETETSDANVSPFGDPAIGQADDTHRKPSPDYTDRQNTELNDQQKKEYQTWLVKESEIQGRDVSKDIVSYDMQGYWLWSGGKHSEKPGDHYDGRWKKTNHPGVPEESPWAKNGEGGKWEGSNATGWRFTPSRHTLAMHGEEGVREYLRQGTKPGEKPPELVLPEKPAADDESISPFGDPAVAPDERTPRFRADEPEIREEAPATPREENAISLIGAALRRGAAADAAKVEAPKPSNLLARRPDTGLDYIGIAATEGGAADRELADAIGSRDPERIAAASRRVLAVPKSDPSRRVEAGERTPEMFGKTIPEVMARSLGAQLPMMLKDAPARVALGAGAGAGAGALVGPVGALTGAGWGAASGLADTIWLESSRLDRGNRVMSKLMERGYDVTDPASISKAMEDGVFDQEFATADRRANVVGGVDAATALVSGGVGAKMLRSGFRKGATAAAVTGIEAAGGATGEASGQLAINEPIDWWDVGMEAAAEIPGAAIHAAPSAVMQGTKPQRPAETDAAWFRRRARETRLANPGAGIEFKDSAEAREVDAAPTETQAEPEAVAEAIEPEAPAAATELAARIADEFGQPEVVAPRSTPSQGETPTGETVENPAPADEISTTSPEPAEQAPVNLEQSLAQTQTKARSGRAPRVKGVTQADIDRVSGAPPDDNIAFSQQPARQQVAPEARRHVFQRQTRAWRDNLYSAYPRLARTVDLIVIGRRGLEALGGQRAEAGQEIAAAYQRKRDAGWGTVYLVAEWMGRVSRGERVGRLSHELGHHYWQALDDDTRAAARELFEAERDTRTGPLYRDGKLITENYGSETDVQEWFGERIALNNQEWLRGDLDAARHDGTVIGRVAARVRMLARAAIRALRPDIADEQVDQSFRDFIRTGAPLRPDSASVATSRRPAVNAGASRMFASAAEKMGTTRDVREAGYVLPDGTMLDFSGRRDGGGGGVREMDHREIEWDGMPDYAAQAKNHPYISNGGTLAMLDFMRAGAMRVDFNSGLISLHGRAITEPQIKAARDIVAMNGGVAWLDLETDDDARASISFDTDRPARVSGLLRRWAEGDDLEKESGGVQFSQVPASQQPADWARIDAEYMRAVESGDAKAQQRIVDEAARRAGYTVGPVITGRRSHTTTFKPSDGKAHIGEGGRKAFYFTENEREALSYNPVLHRVYLSMDNPMRTSEYTERFTRGDDAFRRELDAGGFDGAIYEEPANRYGLAPKREFLVYDPARIKSADPITRDDSGRIIPPSERFNPARDDIRFSQQPSQPPAQPPVSTIDLTERFRPIRLPAIGFESAADLLERQQSPVARRLARAINRYADAQQGIEGRIVGGIERVLARAMRPARIRAKADFNNYYRAQVEEEARRSGPAAIAAAQQRARRAASPLGRQLIDAWRAMVQDTGALAQSYNVQVWDESLNGGRGAYRPIGTFGPDYFPRFLRDDVHNAIQNPILHPLVRDRLINEMVAWRNSFPRRTPFTRAEAEEWFRAEAPAFVTSDDHFGQLEVARRNSLPPSFYETDFDIVSSRFVRGYSRRLSQILAFGQKLRRDPDSRDLIDEAMDEAQSNPYTRSFLDALRRQIYGTRINALAEWFAENARVVASGTLLANPFSTVPRNVISAEMAMVDTVGLRRTLQALTAMRRELSHLDAVQLGVIRAGFLDAVDYSDPNTTASKVVRKAANATLKASGYTGSEVFVRWQNACAAMIFLREWASAMAANPRGGLSMQGEAFLRRVGIDPTAVASENGDWQTGTATRAAIRKIVRETQFGYDVDQVPLWANSPTGRFLYQYGRWGTQRSRYVWRHVLQPAIYGQLVDRGGTTYRVRNMKPMGRVLLTLPFKAVAVGGIAVLTGEAFAAMAHWLFGRDRDDASWEQIWREMSERDTNALVHAGQRLWNDIMLGGMLGIFSQPMDYFASMTQGSRFKNPIEPPATSVIRSASGLTQSWMERGFPRNKEDAYAGHGKDLWMAFETVAPVLRSAKQTAANFVAEALPNIEGLQLEQRKIDVMNLHKLTRRFGREVGIEVDPQIMGARFRKNPWSAGMDRLQSKILLGDAPGARQILVELLAREADTGAQRDRLSRIKSSISARQPLKVGTHYSEEVKRDFATWAEKNLPAAQVELVRRVNDTYLKTARAIGLMDEPTPRERMMEAIRNARRDAIRQTFSDQKQAEAGAEELARRALMPDALRRRLDMMQLMPAQQ